LLGHLLGLLSQLGVLESLARSFLPNKLFELVLIIFIQGLVDLLLVPFLPDLVPQLLLIGNGAAEEGAALLLRIEVDPLRVLRLLFFLLPMSSSPLLRPAFMGVVSAPCSTEVASPAAGLLL
jgi:hypothetical protein